MKLEDMPIEEQLREVIIALLQMECRAERAETRLAAITGTQMNYGATYQLDAVLVAMAKNEAYKRRKK